MRQVRYSVAMSLDGYIAGPHGEADWIVMDPDPGEDFGSYMSRFDTLLIGRKTFLAMQAIQGDATAEAIPEMDIQSIVFSRTLRQADFPTVTIVNEAVPFVADLKSKTGKDIWLWGGGELFHSLLEAGLVDGVDVGLMPVLLGEGIPLLPPPADTTKLILKCHRASARSGVVSLEYDLVNTVSA